MCSFCFGGLQMKKIIGVLLIIAGVLGGLYLGLYIMLFGGICQIIDGLNPLEAKDIALGIIRVLFCEVGAIPAWLGIITGVALYLDE